MKVQNINNTRYQYGLETKPAVFSAFGNKASLNELRNNQISFEGLFDGVKIKLKAQEYKKDATKVLESSKEVQQQAEKVLERSINLRSIAQGIVRKSIRVYADIKSAMDIAKAQNLTLIVNPEDEDNIRVFRQQEDKLVMSEYQKGELIKKAVLDDKTLVVTDCSLDKDNAYIFDAKTSQLIQYSTAIQSSAVGYKADRVYKFNDNQLVVYGEDMQSKPSSYETASDYYIFQNGSLTEYWENYHNDFDGFKKADTHFGFIKTKLVDCARGIKKVEGAVEQRDESFIFSQEDGLHLYSANLKQVVNGDDTADKIYNFYEGRLINAKFGYFLDRYNREKCDEVFYYNYETGKFRSYEKDKEYH